MRGLFISLTIVAIPIVALGQANRTWVSGVGDDVNPCSRTAPCKTFAGAIMKTAIGGEIDCLDPGGFGTVTITKSITIDGTGTLSSILSPATNGVNINLTATPDPSKTVRLRGISINGLGTGLDAVKIIAATHVFIDDVVIEGFTKNGININAGGSFVQVTRSTIHNVSKFGINADLGAASTAATNVSVESSNISDCEAAVASTRGANITVRNSALLHNAIGVVAQNSEVMLDTCLIAHGGRGVFARAKSTIRLSMNTVTNNQTGLLAEEGKIISFKNNAVHGNVVDGTPPTTVPLW
jgi:parallel beta helix pectate lyase-like protein